MFVGHYSVAFAARTEGNKIPLWVLFIACQLLDFVWAALVLCEIEKVRVIPNFIGSNMLDSYYMPYSHSLVMALLWSAIFAAIYKIGWRQKASRGALLIVGVAVFSHWVLDLIAHWRDLPVYGNALKLGLGLWKYPEAEFALEVSLLAGGIALYVARNSLGSVRRSLLIIFGAVLTVILVGDMFVPRNPLTAKQTAVAVWISYSAFVGAAFLLERNAPTD